MSAAALTPQSDHRVGPGGGLDRLPPVQEGTAPTAEALARLAEAAQPVVLRGLVADWSAVAQARRSPAALNAYLRALDQGHPVPVMEAPASSGGRFGYAEGHADFTFSKRQRGLAETLDRIERSAGQDGAPVIAIQMLPLAASLPGFVQDNPLSQLPGVAPLLWLGGPVKTQIHNDRDDNLACVVAGRRRFVLFPPEQVANLYIGPPEKPPPLSLVDPEAPDLDRFPRFAGALASAQAAELGPGDALFLPRHWWHHVTSRDPYNAMVNYWWGRRPQGAEDPQTAFLVALLALGQLPAAEQAYWRAMFETYVFGEGAGHLPAHLQGMLGRLGPAAKADLRARIKSSLLKPI